MIFLLLVQLNLLIDQTKTVEESYNASLAENLNFYYFF